MLHHVICRKVFLNTEKNERKHFNKMINPCVICLALLCIQKNISAAIFLVNFKKSTNKCYAHRTIVRTFACSWLFNFHSRNERVRPSVLLHCVETPVGGSAVAVRILPARMFFLCVVRKLLVSSSLLQPLSHCRPQPAGMALIFSGWNRENCLVCLSLFVVTLCSDDSPHRHPGPLRAGLMMTQPQIVKPVWVCLVVASGL